MVQSLNRKVDFNTKANLMSGGVGSKHGDILIGDQAFEFYNERNPESFLQIPWVSIEKVRAQLFFGNRYIRGFFIDTDQGVSFNFIVKDAGKSLKAMRTYLGNEKIVRNVPVFSLKRLFKRGQK
ncbi:DUF956 family protein [Eremococcus coleocola]|uniref:DUF956 family protein n=1 Tax=Eremococcus coleocola TaxID=88132 RepID=UPI00040458F2|nr:DUF956 family protein [Eremococcus coleocola]